MAGERRRRDWNEHEDDAHELHATAEGGTGRTRGQGGGLATRDLRRRGEASSSRSGGWRCSEVTGRSRMTAENEREAEEAGMAPRSVEEGERAGDAVLRRGEGGRHGLLLLLRAEHRERERV